MPDKTLPDKTLPDKTPPDTLAAQLMVIAKEPVPGRVKTRLTPAYTPAEAAELAQAALTDTLAAVAATSVTRRILALAGTPGRWLPPGFDVIAQRGGDLDERLAWALADALVTSPDPLVFVGMDTPQVTPALLEQAIEPLVAGTADATFGPAEDGGFWLLGLREVDPTLVLGVPMSRADTGVLQLARLTAAGLRVQVLPVLTDVDTAAEAELIAAQVPGSRFGACHAAMRGGEPSVRPSPTPVLVASTHSAPSIPYVPPPFSGASALATLNS
jgi:rSAM/selenodomain-associated transferase 1